MSAAVLLAVVLAQALPPNHPPIGDQPVPAKTPIFIQGGADAGTLPPGHPPMAGQAAAPGSGKLPPGHPPMGSEPPPGGAGLPSGHPPVGTGKAPPDLDELMRQLDTNKELRAKDKPFEIALALGRLYYSHARYQDAAEFILQALGKAEPARKLFLEQRRKATAGKKELPAPESVGCAPAPERSLEQALALAREKAASDAAAAAACARTALHPVMEAELMLANARFITGDSAGALERYDRILEISESHPDARFGRAAVILDAKGDDLRLLARAKEDLTRFTADYPTAPRTAMAKELLALAAAAHGAGGMSKLAKKRAAEAKTRAPQLPAGPPHPPMGPGAQPPMAAQQGSGAAPALSQDVIDSVKNTERTPEFNANLQRLIEEAEEHLAKRRFQDALNNYRGVIPFEPENGRARAGMAWALVGLDKQPMADRMWGVAVSSDPAAVDRLGDTLKAKGDAKGARDLWARLARASPEYAGKVAGKLK